MAVRLTVGLILTALWFGAAALHMHGSWSSIMQFDAGRTGSLVLEYSGELAFFWLVLGYVWLVSGYFQQRADLRQNALSVRRAVEQAEAMTRKVESEAQRFEAYRESWIRAAQPHWEIQGFIAHREQHDINLRNLGAAASRIRVTCDQKLPLAIVLSNPVLVDRGQPLMIKVLCREARLDSFELALEYCDALGESRKAHIVVSELTVTLRHHEEHPAAAILGHAAQDTEASASAA